MNIKRKNNSEWLKTNNLSINIDKTNFIIFHNQRSKDNLTFKLTTFIIKDTL